MQGANGANHRLILNGESGEILDSGRSLIRIHGGRQEVYNNKSKKYEAISNAALKKTHGCLRCLDGDVKSLKEITDGLKAIDPEEFGGKLTVIDDLVEKDGEYKLPVEAAAAEGNTEKVSSKSTFFTTVLTLVTIPITTVFGNSDTAEQNIEILRDPRGNNRVTKDADGDGYTYMRPEPGKGEPTRIDAGETIELLQTEGEYTKIKYGNKTGYIKNKYISKNR